MYFTIVRVFALALHIMNEEINDIIHLCKIVIELIIIFQSKRERP